MKKLILILALIVMLATAVSANPVISPIGSKSVVEGSPITFEVANTGAPNGTVTFTKDLTTLGTLTYVSDAKSTFTWTPGYSDSGVYTFKFTATDLSGFDDESVTINVVDATSTLSLSDLTIGSSTQKRTNGITGTLSVTNTGNIVADNIQLSTVGVATNYNVRFSPANFTSIAAGASQSVTITIDIPKSHDAIDADFNETAIKVGDLKATGTSALGAVETTGALNVQARNRLELDQVIVSVDGDDKTLSSNGKTLDDLKPFQELDFELFARNRFSDSEDVSFDDVEFRILIDDNAMSIDDTDTTSIAPKETESVSFNGDEIDNEANGKFTMQIYASGRDENGALHGESWTLKLKVDRQSHEIEILSAKLLPTTLSCDSRDLTADVKIRNIGTRDENEVSVQVQIPKLKIDEMRKDIDLDSGDSSNEQFFITISDDAKGKNLDVYVKTYYRGDRSSHSEVLKLTVEDCSVEPEPSTTSDDTTSNSGSLNTNTANSASTSGTTTATTSSTPRTRVSGTSSSTGSDDELAISLLVAGVLVVLALIVMLTVFLVKGKK